MQGRVIRSIRWAALLLAFAFGARAEDIDLYIGTPPATDIPNVLLVVDNSANWSASLSKDSGPVGCTLIDTGFAPTASNTRDSKFWAVQCALYNLVHTLPTAADGSAAFNVGFMLFNESPIDGGYARHAMLPMTAAGKQALKTKILGLHIQDDRGKGAQFGRTLYEAYLYFKGETPHRGTAGSEFDSRAISGGRYAPPGGNGCGRNFVVFIANGGPADQTNAEVRTLLEAAGGNVTPIVNPNLQSSDQANWSDEMTRFMNSVDVGSGDGRQNIVTHAIAVTGASSDGLYPNFIRSMAAQGGGRFYEASATSGSVLSTALSEIFLSIQSVNSVFAAVSLPLSANGQGTFRNQVFVGMFRPDEAGGPRWNGNLKQYQMAYDTITDTLTMVDADGRPAVNPATGFFDPLARSFWTTPSTFWINTPSGTPASTSDSSDGEVVEKGAAAQRLRSTLATSQAGRRLYTCITCATGTALSAAQFVTSNTSITAAALGVTDSASREALIEWIRGRDNAGDEKGPGTPTTVRPSVHGDVLHSRPVVIDHGGTDGVVVYYGANDGVLRAVSGAQGGTGAGDEIWGFVAPEFYGKLKRLRDDAPVIRYPNVVSASALPRDYFFDGPIGVYRNSATNQTVIYPTMRRGGRTIYAIDVSNPRSPVILWRVSSAQIPKLGQTWSEPKVARIREAGRVTERPLLVLGGGYDATAEDTDPVGTTTTGNTVLVLDALTGALVRQFDGVARSVASDVALVDSDYDGFIDRAYAADTGANIYRIDFENAGGAMAATDWTLFKVADLSDSVGSRKFLNAPDIVLTQRFTALLIGSGDREKPLKNTSDNRFFVVKDLRLQKGPPALWTNYTAASLGLIGATGQDFTRGCFLPMSSGGEKVVTTATTLGGRAYFSTHRPTPPSTNSCSANLGEARAYELPLFCNAAESQVLVSGGLPPSPVSGLIEISVVPPGSLTPITKVLPFVIGGITEKGSALESKRVVPPIPVRRQRAYWYMETDR